MFDQMFSECLMQGSETNKNLFGQVSYCSISSTVYIRLRLYITYLTFYLSQLVDGNRKQN